MSAFWPLKIMDRPKSRLESRKCKAGRKIYSRLADLGVKSASEASISNNTFIQQLSSIFSFLDS